ncbi:MAG: 4-hydroxyphenylpyruvate dioxygenase [[Candidatus Thermochlorobacteriaceae] bacterium GBChlB]|jgi:4-hydroxyphenylpyruvate dioxygenase|nr:MAG: 4-hydroxyphenylpyruvate dioxygenase [[Candidatus Thermochlorobacteriaceae] bacterium GBChlB]
MSITSKALPVRDFDYVEFYVGNAKQAAHYYRAVLGFDIKAYQGPETGKRDCASYLVQQGKICFILTSPLSSSSEIAAHIQKHGDGVKDVAFETDDARAAYQTAIERGATSAYEPIELRDEHGVVVKAGIRTYGDTIHSFVERKNYNGIFLPGFVEKASTNGKASYNLGLRAIDHIVGNVGWNEMELWVKFYETVFGFHQFQNFDDKDISTEYSALRSKVMSNPTERIKMPINEPAHGKKKSQIEEYIQFYEGAGVQHIALLTDDIIKTVGDLRARGAEFISVPEAYYDTLTERVPELREPMEELKKENILVDKDEHGYMLQIFTKPVEDRPTLFYEVIQRRGSKSFGKGNFKALFQAIERDQALRGNL